MLFSAGPNVSASNVGFSFQTAKAYNSTFSISAVSMATDSHGYAHLAYGVLDESGAEDLFFIYYTTNRGGSWTTKVVDGPYANYSMTSIDPSAWIFVDSKDGIHILYNCYIEVATDSVWGGKYASKAAGASSFTVTGLFDDKNARLLAAALGPNDTMSIVCEPIIASAEVTVYATKAPGGSFVSSSIPLSPDYGIASLAVASDGTPYLAYTSGVSPSVRLECIYKTGSTWTSEVVDPHIGRGYFVSIGLNSTGMPRVLYGRDSGGTFDDQEVRYSEHDGAGWKAPKIIQIYDETLWVVGNLAMAGDVSHLVYRSTTPALVTPTATTFNYSHGSGGSFETQTVDANRSGAAAAVSVDSNGGLHVAFVSPNPSTGGDDILYSTTGTPTPIETGSLDIALILGVVAVLAVVAIAALFLLRRKK